MLAIDHLDVLGDDMVPHIRRVGTGGKLDGYVNIETALTAHGYEPDPSSRGGLSRFPVSPGGPASILVLPLLHDAQRVGAPASALSPHEQWRLADLCTLFDLIDVSGASMHGFAAARGEPADVRLGWLIAVATAGHLDRAAVASQAAAALREHTLHKPSTVAELLLTPAPEPPPTLDASLLTPRDLDILVYGLTSRSDWMAESAWSTLWNHTDDHLRARIIALLGNTDLSPEQRENLTALAVRLQSQPSDDRPNLPPATVIHDTTAPHPETARPPDQHNAREATP